MRIRKSIGEVSADVILVAINIMVLFITLYPFIFVFSVSISDQMSVVKQEVWLFPKGFSTEAYKRIFQNPDLWNSYYNTLWYVVVGTLLNLFVTMTAAYSLSRKGLIGWKYFMFFISFTMFFGGGLIPSYLLIQRLGLYDTRWALVIPAAVSAWNIILARMYIKTIPDSLYESCKIDGANDIVILRKIILPLSMPIIAVLILYNAVGFWNSYFSALIYLRDPKLHPLQLYLMKILVESNPGNMIQDINDSFERGMYVTQMKYSIIIVSILPIICVYPFLQKYFVKGIIIGAIKE